MLTQDLLNELFWYDEVVGQLRWKARRGSRAKVNGVAGTIVKGYWNVRVNGKRYPAHRLIWTMIIGEIPEGYEIDHIDGDRANNHISNLRLATHGENLHNCRKQCNNTSGTKGISFNKATGKWHVTISKDSKKTQAEFAAREEAEAFVRQVRELLHEDFTNHGTHKKDLQKEDV